MLSSCLHSLPARALRRASTVCSAQRAAAQTLDYSVVAVPRTTADGEWREADEQLVEAALRTPEPPPSTPLLGLSLAQLKDLALADGQPAFRGQQLHTALYGRGKPCRSLADASTLPAAWRESLAARGRDLGRSAVHAVAGSEDGTTKLLLRLADGRVVETVGIPAEDATHARLTVCVSSQVGCPMRCTFCATGAGGFARNLAPHEILDQVLHVQEHFDRRVSHIVFMGMGEPMLNLRNVLAAQRALTEDLGISARRQTISTVGVPNTLARLAAAELPVTLAVSLHAPNQRLRESIIPSAKAYPLAALLEDCAAYQAATGRRISFEYTLLENVNDSPAHATELGSVLSRYGLQGHVNVIPYNPVDGAAFSRPSGNAVHRFTAALSASGCGSSIRRTRGADSAAACGQLRNKFQSGSERAPAPR